MMRKGHGRGKGQPRIEVAETLPEPIIKGVGRGGATKVVLARKLTLRPTGDPRWEQYSKAAEQFRISQCRELARQAGGRCGMAPSTMIASAALQLAMSRYMLDKGAEDEDMALMKQASALMNDSRQNLLAAFELATREAVARRLYEKNDPMGMLEEATRESLPLATSHVANVRVSDNPTPDSKHDESNPTHDIPHEGGDDGSNDDGID